MLPRRCLFWCPGCQVILTGCLTCRPNRKQRTENPELNSTLSFSMETIANDCQPLPTSANLSHPPVMRSLARVRVWDKNPRQGEYEKMEELKDSLQRVGLQDAIHVWPRPDGDYLLKGHRRFRGMSELGWVECLQVVHDFEDEREAFKYLLQDHGHTVPLNNEEKVVAMLTGVDMGLTVEDLAAPMGVREEQAQLWFNLGKLLPVEGREALASGVLSMNVAEELIRIPDAKERREATQGVLFSEEEPLSPARARMYINSKFVLPRQWEENWVKLSAQLAKKKHKVADGYHYVSFSEREVYTMGTAGQPETDYELGCSYMPKGSMKTWLERAQELGVTVFVVAAPRHKDEYVLIVSRAMIKDAERSLAAQKVDVEEREGAVGDGLQSFAVGGGGLEEGPSDEDGPTVGTDSEAPETTANDSQPLPTTANSVPPTWWRVMLGAVYEALLEDKGKATQTNPPWQVVGFALAQCPDILPRFEAWTGRRGVEGVLEWISADNKARGSMRMVLMLLLCLPALGGADVQAPVRAMLEALDLDAADLERIADGAGEE